VVEGRIGAVPFLIICFTDFKMNANYLLALFIYFIFNGSRYGSNGRSGGDHANHTTP
jgi:hypothetical protein